MGKKYQYRENSNRTHLVTVRFTDDEFTRLNFICDRLNVTKAEHIRTSVFHLGEGGPADNEIRDAINDCISDMNEELRFLRTVRAYHGDLKASECS